MIPKASQAHSNLLITSAIGPAFGFACIALQLTV